MCLSAHRVLYRPSSGFLFPTSGTFVDTTSSCTPLRLRLFKKNWHQCLSRSITFRTSERERARSCGHEVEACSDHCSAHMLPREILALFYAVHQLNWRTYYSHCISLPSDMSLGCHFQWEKQLSHQLSTHLLFFAVVRMSKTPLRYPCGCQQIKCREVGAQ